MITMQPAPDHPDSSLLGSILTDLVAAELPAGARLTITDRAHSIQGTFPKEVVTCRGANGREWRFFCKYSGNRDHVDHGHRGGVAYESRVYREVLLPGAHRVPALHGVHVDPTGGGTWLILEFLDRAVRVKSSTDPDAMGLAARWIGGFHAAGDRRLQDAPPPSFLTCYDAEYYRGWARRTLDYAGPMRRRLGWLEPLCRRFEESAADLCAASPTWIHGEFYPRNILYLDGRIYPVDWESAAIAAGEIDIASLTELWADEVVRECERQYVAARWPGGPPGDLEKRLWAARLYLQLRWLGDHREGPTSQPWRLEQLHDAGLRTGLI